LSIVIDDFSESPNISADFIHASVVFDGIKIVHEPAGAHTHNISKLSRGSAVTVNNAVSGDNALITH
jgi:hypothetical protein